MRILLAAGGSGGHIFPAVALAKELEKKGVGKISFISSKRRLDKSILGKEKYDCYFLSANPMPYKFNPVRMIVFIAKLFADICSAVYLLIKIRPNAVVGFGGYSSGGASLCAKLFGIPVLIHEQNVIPGRANKILAKLVDKIAISFENGAEYFDVNKEKIVFTGNPLREDMLTGDRKEALSRMGLSPEKATVLVMGGSQGSTSLNNTVSRTLLDIKEKKSLDIQFVHLTGKKDYDSIKEFYEEHGLSGRVYDFLDKIDDAYAVSDVAVSRSGAAAVFELASYARPMILVPYPNPKNNQRSNAIYFSEKGAALYREEKDFTTQNLAEDIVSLLTDGEKHRKMSDAAFMLSKNDAGEILAKEVMALARGKGLKAGS